MAKTSIEWATDVWNPTTGCDRISKGCDNCYALRFARRLKAMGQEKYQTDGDPRTSGPGFGVAVHEDSLNDPFSWTKPRKVFVNSMSDLFHARVPLDFVRRVFEVIEATPQHTYQVLTKRASRLPRVADKLPWPRNLWMGVSVEDATELHRVDDLRKVPAEVRFTSLEPLVGQLGGLDLTGIHWVIVGGESGPGARPMHPDWARSIRDQCIAAGVAFHFKQHGAWATYGDGETTTAGSHGPLALVSPDGRTHSTRMGTLAPAGSVLMARYGKHRSGRELDGRTWDEFPATALAGAR
ncbi:MAG TPA: phage Gp37/Gp68 family protein [Sporichthya sp.]|nr:phage Gp37/Gp68 family protein [Sporichthya sp.]